MLPATNQAYTGRLFTFEGIDATGKRTQSQLLQKRLEQNYGETTLYSFPQYSTPTGQIIADYLNGKMTDLSLLERARLYMNDRLAVRDKMYDQLYRGVHIVCDRYVHSNVGFFVAMAKMMEQDGKAAEGYADAVNSYILASEFEHNQMPKIDVMFVLTAPVDVCIELGKQKAKRDYTDSKQDIHEADTRLLATTHEVYTSERYFKPDDYVKDVCRFDCYNKVAKEMLKIDDIGYRVFQRAKKSLESNSRKYNNPLQLDIAMRKE